MPSTKAPTCKRKKKLREISFQRFWKSSIKLNFVFTLADFLRVCNLSIGSIALLLAEKLYKQTSARCPLPLAFKLLRNSSRQLRFQWFNVGYRYASQCNSQAVHEPLLSYATLIFQVNELRLEINFIDFCWKRSFPSASMIEASFNKTFWILL